jgi:hypothetical protein
MRLKPRLLQLPPSIDIVTFIEFDGNPPDETSPSDAATLVQLRDRRLKTHRNGSLEQSTLDGIELHFKHLLGTLGERFPILGLSMADLQQHVDPRAKKKGLNGRLSPATIRKEIVTLRTAWKWGSEHWTADRETPEHGAPIPEVL